MSTRIPVELEGNLTADPKTGTTTEGTDYAQFQIAVNDRRFDEATNTWENSDTVFHNVVVYGAAARNTAKSLKKGDAAIVIGEMKFGTYTNPETNVTRDTRDVVARSVGASLRFNGVEVQRGPKASGPAVHATGPVVTPFPSTTGPSVA